MILGIEDPFPFSKRAIVYKGSADLKTILKEERAGKYIEKVQGERNKEKCWLWVRFTVFACFSLLIVVVSGNDKLRDDLREHVRGYLREKVRLVELEFQPT